MPVPGGRPRLLLANASGLTWIESGTGQSRLLFSELTGRGQQMAVVSSTESGAQHRTVYMRRRRAWPTAPIFRRIGSRSLVVEMDHGSWLPCRLTPFDGSLPESPSARRRRSAQTLLGPLTGSGCISRPIPETGITFGASASPDSEPQQVTVRRHRRRGNRIHSDGRSFVTSIGTSQSTVWLHDSQGNRQITSEGYGFLPSISPDGKKLYYLLARRRSTALCARRALGHGLGVRTTSAAASDFLMRHYSISADGRRVVFVASDDTGRSPVWMATLTGRSAPRRVTAHDGRKAYFIAGGYVDLRGRGEGSKVRFPHQRRRE